MDRSTPLRVLNRHGSSVEVVKFHPNSILLASGGADDRIRLWDPRVPDIVGLIQGVRFPKVLEFSNDGTMLAISGSSSEAYVWDLVAGKVANKFKTGHHVTSMSFAHGGEILAMTVGKNRIQIWDTMGTGYQNKILCNLLQPPNAKLLPWISVVSTRIPTSFLWQMTLIKDCASLSMNYKTKAVTW